METTLKLLLVSGDQLFRLGAFVAVIYFAAGLYRARVEGSTYLLFGCIAVLLGEGAKVVSFTGMAPGQLWIPALLLTSLGFCAAAFGFAKLAQLARKRQ